MATSVFVYGTLKRGECREPRWPVRPQRVCVARIRAQLYDLGPYPAILSGDDWVVGERWDFAAHDIDLTLAVLDDVEGYREADDDWYRRRIVPCFDEAGIEVSAHAYFFAQAERLVRIAKRIMPNNGQCQWLSKDVGG